MVDEGIDFEENTETVGFTRDFYFLVATEVPMGG